MSKKSLKALISKGGERMNFYEELEQEFKNAGINGRIISVPEELKPTAQDIADLDQRIAIRCAENERMMSESAMYAEHSLPVQQSNN